MADLDISAWKELERDLQAFMPDLQKELDRELMAAGRVVADEVRRRITRDHGGGRMAGSVRVKRTGRALVSVTVEARDPGTGYRYPGRVHFDTTRRHSDFLYGAAEAKRDEVERMVGDALDRTIKRVLT